ncbi:MAG: GNAT family N-acetyltransferase [Anaerolineaceae bacterium]|nr:GNAT family N-acetyltransferase [Anaerolineaceae bacterium]
MKINIRKATLDDYSAVCAVYEEIDAQHRDQLPHIFRKSDGTVREKEYFLGLISDEQVGFFVAEVDGIIAGFGHVMLVNAHDFPILVPRQYAVVDCIAIKDGFQHHGIGKALMAEMQEWAVSKEASAIELNVYEFNRNAISFYEGLGYQTYSRKMNKKLM